jgi:hypothetical protein
LEYHHAHQMGVIEIIGITCLQHWKDRWLTWLLVWPKQCPYSKYCNPSLGLTTKARSCEGASQKWSLGVTLHALGSVGECEGMNFHTSKWAPILGMGVPMDSQIFKGWLQGSNSLDWRAPYIIGKLLELKYLKWACMTHLGTYNTSYG